MNSCRTAPLGERGSAVALGLGGGTTHGFWYGVAATLFIGGAFVMEFLGKWREGNGFSFGKRYALFRTSYLTPERRRFLERWFDKRVVAYKPVSASWTLVVVGRAERRDA